jgi:DNA repair exonuclease SbcCD ATPase subunit
MSSSRSTLKRNQLRHRLGIDTHHGVSVCRQEPWYRRSGRLVLATLLGAGLLLSYQMIDRYLQPQERELVQLREKVKELSAEVERLNASAGTGPNAILMAQAAQQTLLQQLEKAQADLAKFKEDLGFCEKNAKAESGVRKAPIFVPGAGTIPANSSPNN